MKIGISACLTGYRYRYDGTDKRNDELIRLLSDHELIPVCPEHLAGLFIPHLPIELKDGKAFMSDGSDVTDRLKEGSDKGLELIRDCDFLILKSKSPSCGYKKIYDGSFRGKLIDSNGMFAQMCLENNMKIFTEEDLDKIREYILR